MTSIRPCLLSSSFALTRTFRAPPSTRLDFIRTASLIRTASTYNKVSDVVKTDHRELEDYYDKMMRATDDDTKTRWQNQFCWELARHSIAEELVVYPAMEKNLGVAGKDQAEKDRAQHQTLKEHLKTFQNLETTDPSFEPTIKALMADLSQHIKEEEASDLPELEKALTADDSAGLAKSFERTKMFVPSRSHPSTPNRPPFETLAGLLAAPIDKIGDLFRKFPKNKD